VYIEPSDASELEAMLQREVEEVRNDRGLSIANAWLWDHQTRNLTCKDSAYWRE
jgi:hypothetical protein